MRATFLRMATLSGVVALAAVSFAGPTAPPPVAPPAGAKLGAAKVPSALSVKGTVYKALVKTLPRAMPVRLSVPFTQRPTVITITSLEAGPGAPDMYAGIQFGTLVRLRGTFGDQPNGLHLIFQYAELRVPLTTSMWKKDEIHFFAPTVDALHVAPPTGPKRYVEHSTRGNVLIVDASGNTIAGVNQVPIGVNPANADHDGDGHVAIAWGGDDCDDADGSRYPTNAEVPDSDAHDEDCDPLTFGCADADGDRWCDARACNRDPSYGMRCGDDCDDNDPNVHPAQVDVCNGKDDNCNGLIDEGLIGCPTTQH